MNKKLFLFSIPFFIIGFLFLFRGCNPLKASFNIYPDRYIPTIQVYFSPDDDIRSILLKLINNEKIKISCAVFRLTEKNIAAEIVKAHRRGVKIEIVVDKDGFSGSYSKVLHLFKEGIKVYIFPPIKNSDIFDDHEDSKISSPYGALMHNKFFIFHSQETIFTGSYNYTKQAQDANQENVVIIHDKNTFEKYKKHYQILCSRSTAII